MRKSKGYTLIELLVVIFIISIVTSVALLSINHNENKKFEALANDLTQMMSLAEEQAMLQPTVLGLSFSEHAFQFASLKAASTDKKENEWIPLQANLGKHSIPNDIQVAIEVGSVHTVSTEDTIKSEPQIIVSMNGDITPFIIYIGKKGEKPRYVITGDADGNVTNKALS